MTIEKLEEWLKEVRAGLARADEIRKAGGGKGRIAVRAAATDLNWLQEQLGPGECCRIDMVVGS